MRKVISYNFTEKEKNAIRSLLDGSASVKETAEALGCAYEQVRIILGKILTKGYSDGWIKIDFTKM